MLSPLYLIKKLNLCNRKVTERLYLNSKDEILSNSLVKKNFYSQVNILNF